MQRSQETEKDINLKESRADCGLCYQAGW